MINRNRRRLEERTLAYLRAQGVVCDCVSWWIYGPGETEERTHKHDRKGRRETGHRRSLYHWQYIQAIRSDGIVGIQCTSLRMLPRKITGIQTAEYRASMMAWLKSGGKIEIWGWYRIERMGKDGKRLKIKEWQPRIIPILLENFP